MSRTYRQEKEFQKREHLHRTQMELLKVLQNDPDMKYYLGVAMGSAAAVASTLAGSLSDVSTPPPEPTEPPSTGGLGLFGWLATGGIGGLVGLPLWLKTAESMPEGTGTGDPFGMVAGIVQLSGVGFAGFCASVLILKAMFGEDGMAEVLKGIGEIVPL